MKRLVCFALLASILAPGAAWAKKKKEEPPPPPPVEAPAPAPDPEAWRATAPAAGPERPWAPPAAKVFNLPNGIPVYLVERPGLPLVSVELLVLASREAEPKGKAGLASLTASMLDEGTTTHTGAELASAAALLGANLSSGQDGQAGSVALDALTGDSLAPSLDLLADVALHPKFAQADFDRVKAQTLTAIQAAKADPNDVAGRAFAAQLFGTAHPYGTPVIGSEATVKALTSKDVKTFYSTWWNAKNAAIVVSGAVTQAEIEPLLAARFGAWKAGKTTRPTVSAPSATAKTRLVFVEMPGAVQSVIRVGTVGPARTSPDFMASNVSGTLLAGMFSSRVNMNLREEHGWSYGAYGGFSESRDFGTFAIRTSVQADKTAPSVTEIMKELAAAQAHTPTDAELKTTKDYLAKSLPGNFETNSATAGSFEAAPELGLGPDLWAAYLKDLAAVDGPQAALQSKRYFDASKQLIVVAGPRAVDVPGENGTTTHVDVVKELQGLGYEFVDLSEKKVAGGQ